MTQLVEYKTKALQVWFENNPALASRGIDEAMWNALCTSVYPGAKPDSVLMAVDYCAARNLDIMLKPVHLVPMNVAYRILWKLFMAYGSAINDN